MIFAINMNGIKYNEILTRLEVVKVLSDKVIYINMKNKNKKRDRG